MNTRRSPGHGTGDLCAVCFEPVFCGTQSTVTPQGCPHAVHSACYRQITQAGGIRACAYYTCPTCKNKCFHNKIIITGDDVPLPDSKAFKNTDHAMKKKLISRIMDLALKQGTDFDVLKHMYFIYYDFIQNKS